MANGLYGLTEIQADWGFFQPQPVSCSIYTVKMLMSWAVSKAMTENVHKGSPTYFTKVAKLYFIACFLAVTRNHIKEQTKYI